MSDGETFIWRNLPPDIIPHLLSRLPLKSLCRFKCVSHSWNSLISSTQTHINRTTTDTPPKAIIISSSHAIYSVDFADVNPTAKKLDFPLLQCFTKEIQILGSCNGLLLVSEDFGKSKILWNPFTRECKKMSKFPFSDSRYLYFFKHGLGYDSSTDDYKVVMFTSDSHGMDVDVYSLKTDTWKKFYYSDFPYVEDLTPGVHFNGHLHWFWMSVSKNDTCGILAFDLSNEIFGVVKPPASFDNYDIQYHHLAVVGGCLCLLVCLSRDRHEVWMMKEYGIRESWTRLMMIDSPEMSALNFLWMLSEDDFVFKTSTGPFSIDGRKVLLSTRDKLVVYNTKKETLRDMVIRDIPTEYIVEATYVETLVSPNHQ